MIEQLTWLILIWASLGCGGCRWLMYGSDPAAPRLPWYSIAFANDSDALLKNVHADWTLRDGRPYRADCGILAVGAEARDNEQPDIPAQVVVSWKTPGGREHRQMVEVAKKIPNIGSFNGGVWFKITDAGVELVIMKDPYDFLRLQHKYQYPGPQ
jgi:hypothetical protein